MILIDPMTGSKSEAQAIERQAIGRAYRLGQKHQLAIVRFVIQETAEHKLFMRNNTEEDWEINRKGMKGTKAVVKAKSLATKMLNLSQ